MQNATRKALSENGLSITQGGEPVNGEWRLNTTLRHTSGGSVTTFLPLLAFSKGPQAAGSELTYMRRYAYAAILNITADEDDDANTAQDASKNHSAPTGRHYDVKAAATTAAPPRAPDDGEYGTAVGVVGRIDPNQTGDCWFLSIGALGTAKGESIWCRDKTLVDSLTIGQAINASLRSKTPGKYQLMSFVPAGDEP